MELDISDEALAAKNEKVQSGGPGSSTAALHAVRGTARLVRCAPAPPAVPRPPRPPAAPAPLQCGGRLARRFHGPAYEVFAKVLRGLSGTKLTKPGTFRDAEGHGHAVRCSFKVGARAGLQRIRPRVPLPLPAPLPLKHRAAPVPLPLHPTPQPPTHPPTAGRRRLPVPPGARLLLRPEAAPAAGV